MEEGVVSLPMNATGVPHFGDQSAFDPLPRPFRLPLISPYSPSVINYRTTGAISALVRFQQHATCYSVPIDTRVLYAADFPVIKLQ